MVPDASEAILPAATLIHGGEVYAPEYIGKASLLIGGGRLLHRGELDSSALSASGLQIESVDISGCIVVPGLIDPHIHLLGGSGERGFRTQTPGLSASEIIAGGTTTVVGVLGVDSTTKTMPGLLAKVRGLGEEGLTALLWSGGYGVPPQTLTGSIRSDMLLVQEVIGAGEIAIADLRALEPQARELARLASDCYVGGTLTGKAGLLHVHVGDSKRRLSLLREVLREFDVEPGWFYPTHLERSEALMLEAVEFSKLGMPIDLDVVEEDLDRWFPFFRQAGGDLTRLTISSDASINSPRVLLEQLRRLVLQEKVPLEEVLPIATSNTARILELHDKGRIAAGMSADLVVLSRETLEVVHVWTKGKWWVRDGRAQFIEGFLEQSNRNIVLRGARYEE